MRAILFAVCLSLIAGCSAHHGKLPVTDSVAGTTWTGTDSEGRYYEFMFQASGALHYKSPTGYFKNGAWTQNGNAIYFEMNKKYSEYNGQINEENMAGEAHNVAGRRWKWNVRMKRN